MEATIHAPALTVAMALAVGMVAQTLGRHLRVPSIVLLLGAGVALGPDGAGVIDTGALGAALTPLVGFAVAVILFEGGMNLELARVRRQERAVRRLLTAGALVTLAGGSLAARFLLGWTWSLAVLFGSLVIVTGPTVVTPLLRRVRVEPRLRTVLEAEGVLIDAVGAIVAVVTLELVLHPGTGVQGAAEFVRRFAVGLPAGVAVGAGLAWLLDRDGWIPEGLENVFVLAIVVAAYEAADALVAEAGLVVVTVAGLIVGNSSAPTRRELAEFKEQLTVLLIGMLFVLLAADVRLAEIGALGGAAAGVVAVLMLAVRPLAALLCTAGTSLPWRERLFVAWMAPRGIVAAAVASLFAVRLEAAGIAGGESLRALVFLVIGVTVTVYGLTAAPVAALLGVRRAADRGFVILGANGVGVALASCLRAAGAPAVLVEANAERANRALEAGLAVVFGNGLQESVLQRAQPETRAGAIAVTANEEANLLFVRRAREEFRCPRGWILVDRVAGHVTDRLLRDARVGLLSGRRRDVQVWDLWLERGRARVRAFRVEEAADGDARSSASPPEEGRDAAPAASTRHPLLPLLIRAAGGVAPYDEATSPQAGDTVWAAVDDSRTGEVAQALAERGWLEAVNEPSASAPAPPSGA